VLATITVQQ